MAITSAQRLAAEQKQRAAAIDPSPQVRLVAGPGTGKSKAVEMRVAHILNGGAIPQNVYVISFTRAACSELAQRIAAHCASQPCAAAAGRIHVSTMHSLALRILKSANLLAAYFSSDPLVIDTWECSEIYDTEFSHACGCTPGRAAQIRLAYDASWQTLNPQLINQAAITPQEIQFFNSFHASRGHLYSLVLPGEIVHRCADALSLGNIGPGHLPPIDHLVVDEFQDLNACDQEFVRLLSGSGGTLFAAGDDDQSIYSFRHADPSGLVNFPNVYPSSATHLLSDCFRCTPSVLNPATAMISVNPMRIAKNLTSLYTASAPPVSGSLNVWSFPSAQDEARAIATSCQQLLNAGMSGREDEILILISDRGLQLNQIQQELGNLGLPYEPPRGEALRDLEPIRAVYAILRILRDHSSNVPDYVAHRSLLSLMSGVGPGTARSIGDLCISNHQNFHDLFYLTYVPHWLTGRTGSAVQRISNMLGAISGWAISDTLSQRAAQVAQVLSQYIFTNAAQAAANTTTWNNLVSVLPSGMTFEELLTFLSADMEADQEVILNLVNQRLGLPLSGNLATPTNKIKILTMHGAKGLAGKIVFIPSAEQGIMPSFRALNATGLLIEQRRLFYVSVTRAMAACIVSHAASHTGAAAFRLAQRMSVNLTRSQFLNEMGIASVNRSGGLTATEAAAIFADVSNL